MGAGAMLALFVSAALVIENCQAAGKGMGMGKVGMTIKNSKVDKGGANPAPPDPSSHGCTASNVDKGPCALEFAHKGTLASFLSFAMIIEIPLALVVLLRWCSATGSKKTLKVAWRFKDAKEYSIHETVSDAYVKIDRLDEKDITRPVFLKVGDGGESFHETAVKALQALAPQVAVGTENAKEARLVSKEVQVAKADDRLPVVTFSFQMVHEGSLLDAHIDFGDSIKVCVPNYKPKSYSCSAGGGRDFDITSKGYGGRASAFLHRLEVGDIMHTFSQGKKKRNPGAYVGIVAYGVGITEGLPLARCELEKKDAKKVVLIWSARNMAETWWPETVKELQRKYPERFVMKYALSREKREGCIHGRLTADVLRMAFDGCWGTAPGGPNAAARQGVRFSTTGTKEMMRATDTLYEEMGYPMPEHALLAKPDHKEGHHAEEHHE